MCTSKKNENVLKKGGEIYITRTRLIYVILDDRNTKFLNHRVFFSTQMLVPIKMKTYPRNYFDENAFYINAGKESFLKLIYRPTYSVVPNLKF